MSSTRDTGNVGVAQLEAPRYENGRAMLIAGFRDRYTDQTMNKMTAQWQRFAPHIDHVRGQVRRGAYGLTFLGKGSAGIEYLTGVEVSSCSGLPAEFSCVSVPAQKYAVFQHHGHVSTIRETCGAIATWLPESGHQAAPAGGGAPDFFERYTKDFNPQTGIGGMEIWIPIK
jgi:AraC family transcriptional regulator